MREKTHAHRKMKDDVPEDVKKRRLTEIIDTFHAGARKNNEARIGQRYRVLVSGTSKRDALEVRGTTDGGLKAVFADRLPSLSSQPENNVPFQPGDWVNVDITGATSSTLLGTPVSMGHLG